MISYFLLPTFFSAIGTICIVAVSNFKQDIHRQNLPDNYYIKVVQIA